MIQKDLKTQSIKHSFYLIVIAIAALSLAGITACTPSESIKVPNIGEPVPNISWTTVYGEKINLNQFKGSWVLLCYWCPCPEHRDGIIEIRNVFHESYGQNIEVVVIDDHSMSCPEVTLKGFAEKNNLPFYLVEDNNKSIVNIKSDSNSIHSRPIYFLIDTMGKLNAIKLGSFNYVEGKEDEVINFLHYEDLKVGDIAPDFTSTTVLGNRIGLSQFNGNWVLLHFVCGCASHMQDLDFITYAHENYSQLKTIVVIDWAQCGGDIKDFAQYNKPEFNLTEDKDTSLMKIYRLPKTGRPQSFLIDEKGFVRARQSQFFHDIDAVKSFLKDIPAINRSTFAAPNIFNAKISKITDTTAELYWETDKEATSIATFYWTDSGNELSQSNENINFTKKHILAVDDLKPSTEYSVYFKSQDKNGSIDTHELKFETHYEGFMGFRLDMDDSESLILSPYNVGRIKIQNINIYDITDSGAIIRWSTNKPSRCYIECQHNFPTPDKKGVNYLLTLTDLKPDKEYIMKITAMCWDSAPSKSAYPNLESTSEVKIFKTLKTADNLDMK